jgi:hypothetical protein
MGRVGARQIHRRSAKTLGLTEAPGYGQPGAFSLFSGLKLRSAGVGAYTSFG